MKSKIIFLFILLLQFGLIFSQNVDIKPPILGEKFPDFTLPIYQGGEFKMAEMLGKNVLLISSRGKYADDHWCAICNYQYADFVELVEKDSILEKYNLAIAFLMPYSKDILSGWENAFPGDMKKIEGWKYPENIESQTPDQKNWTDYTRQQFPKTFIFQDDKVKLLLPVLVDENQELSKGLDIFRTEWTGATSPQNIPSVYIVDSKGVLRFKYISQNTFDRPSSDYIIAFIQSMIKP
jgi:peroxiredoxin